MCAHTRRYTLKHKACRVCDRLFSNGMPRLSVRVTSHSPPSCGIALSLFSSQSAGCAHCIHCHSLSFFPLCNLKRQHWPHTHLNIHTNMWATSSSLWLTSCGSPSLTLPLLFGRFLSVRCLTHVVRCVRALPLSNFDVWRFDELQRDSSRVYGTAESGISSASFKVLHHPMDPVFIFSIPHHSHFSSSMFFQLLSQFSSLSFCAPHIFKDVVALICLTLCLLCKCCIAKCGLKVKIVSKHSEYIQVFFFSGC